MADARRQQLELAVRRNRGQALTKSFSEATASALGRPPDELKFVDLAATDDALAKLLTHREALETGRAWAEVVVMLRAPARETVALGLKALRSHLSEQTLLLHRGASEYCGAVEVSAREVLDHAFDLIELDQESVLAANENGRHGIIVEHVTDPVGVGAPTFKLLGWSGLRA